MHSRLFCQYGNGVSIKLRRIKLAGNFFVVFLGNWGKSLNLFTVSILHLFTLPYPA